MKASITRRQMLKGTGAVALGVALRARPGFAAGISGEKGAIAGEPTAEQVGMRVLADGGNAVDAIVAAALVAAVAAPNQTGIGGYGACMTLALGGGRKVISIDANSAAPQAMREDIFKPGADGKIPGQVNNHGWLAAGVPGILAGLQLVLDRYGTRSFRELAQPAIAIARDGYPLSAALATTIRNQANVFAKDAGSLKLYLRDGKPLAAGELFRNRDLAAMLTTLAERNSVASFYRGDIAQQIADAFQKNGGLVTTKDLAAYAAREVTPLSLEWRGLTMFAAPLTSGGPTVLQALNALKAMNWSGLRGFEQTHARIEALRLAWRDRLALFGDPEHVKTPVERFLSDEYARQSAERILAAVKAGKLLEGPAAPRPQSGTISLSAADRSGNLVALTLTHGEAFGARITVDGLGLTLGHGMSRFDPQPGHPNSPGPGKRPLHNMCPTVLLRNGQGIAALGGRGGRRIPNSLSEVLMQFVGLGLTMEES
ncbi:gamma-glutamyltransferase, partial [Candidatus Sumerlaeota bacterium]|nr:gamma-glutamyltransferase [Candidatus Sumerlaeota bacterium]